MRTSKHIQAPCKMPSYILAKPSRFVGVIFAAPNDMTAFDRRENGYQRVEVPAEQVIAWLRDKERVHGSVYV